MHVSDGWVLGLAFRVDDGRVSWAGVFLGLAFTFLLFVCDISVYVQIIVVTMLLLPLLLLFLV